MLILHVYVFILLPTDCAIHKKRLGLLTYYLYNCLFSAIQLCTRRKCVPQKRLYWLLHMAIQFIHCRDLWLWVLWKCMCVLYSLLFLVILIIEWFNFFLVDFGQMSLFTLKNSLISELDTTGTFFKQFNAGCWSFSTIIGGLLRKDWSGLIA